MNTPNVSMDRFVALQQLANRIAPFMFKSSVDTSVRSPLINPIEDQTPWIEGYDNQSYAPTPSVTPDNPYLLPPLTNPPVTDEMKRGALTNPIIQNLQKIFASGIEKPEEESLWHETNQLQLGTTNSDITGLNVATDRDLALGQSGKGVLIEFNKSKLLGSAGQLQAIRKAANDVFGIKEFRVLGGRGDPSAVKSITISPTAQIPREDMIRAKRLFPNIQKLEDGTIILSKK